MEQRAIVAAIHLPPSLSLQDFPGASTALELALRDVNAAIDGGVDAILLENENDKPHTLLVSKAQVAWLTRVAIHLRERIDLPLGINVQRIDWDATLAIAAAADLSFVRLDTFVDRVRMMGEDVVVDPAAVRALRETLGRTSIELWCDVHVKHAELLETRSLEESAGLAVREGAAAVIVSGSRTGEPPSLDDLRAARKGAPCVVVGSGLTPDNARALAAHADRAIVGTALKDGARVSTERTREVVSAWRRDQ